MIDIFLRAKHWQLFLLTFGLPLILQIFFMSSFMTSAFSQGGAIDSSFFSSFFIWVTLLSLVVSFVTFGWQWSVAIGLQKHIPDDVQMKTIKFKIFFLIPMVYMLGILLFMTIYLIRLSPDPTTGTEKLSSVIFSAMFVVIPVHLFAMYCIFYVMYFVAMTIRTVELQRKVSFNDFAGEFFLIWFSFIGFWVLQPKINRFCKGKGTSADNG